MTNKILIHTCCADCLLNTIENLKLGKDVDIVLYFFNPNIHPRSEYLERLNAVKKVLKDTNLPYKLIVPEYKPSQYFDSISKYPKRCIGCWEVRLKNLFEYAKENDIKTVSSTLLTSQYQDTETIAEITKNLSKEYGITVKYSQKEKDIHIHKGFYKQNFCGCCFSLNERMVEKYLNNKKE